MMYRIASLGFTSLAVLLLALILNTSDASATINSTSIKNKFGKERLVLEMNHKGSPAIRRAYLDWDNNAATGFSVNGIGADILLENNSAYDYAGNGSDWAWVNPRAVNHTAAKGYARWKVPYGKLDESATCAPAFKAVFQTEKTNGTLQTSAAQSAADTCPPASLVGRSLLVPAYFYVDEGEPTGCTGTEHDCGYARIITSGAGKSVVIINPQSGPGSALKPEYTGQINALRAADAVVIGYVRSDYGKIPLATVKSEIDAYFDRYTLDGIFVDEMESQSCDDASYYQAIYDHVYARGGALVVGNPGINTRECYASTADVLVTFEGAPAAYKRWQPAAWTSAYPKWRFGHLIYNTKQNKLASLAALWASRHAGTVYFTDITLPNPWEPITNYWETLVNIVSAP